MHWLIFGGGMRGIVAAALLAKRGEKVTLLERNPHLGGIMYADAWDGLYVDKGCHLLDFGHEPSGQLFSEILGDAMHPVERRYASYHGGPRVDDIAVPDFSHRPAEWRKAALADLETAVAAGGKAEGSLVDALNARYGGTIGAAMADAVRKMTAQTPEDADASSIDGIPLLGRVRLAPDAEMIELKAQSPDLDARLAASMMSLETAKAVPALAFPHRNQYPSQLGMRGFCDAALGYLRGLGVEVLLGAQVKSIASSGEGLACKVMVDGEERSLGAETGYWSLPLPALFPILRQDDPAAGSAIPVSLLIYAFRVPFEKITDTTYVHDYRPDTRAFRLSTPGRYGRQSDEHGQSYVSVEVPCRTDQPIWADPDSFAAALFDQARETGIVTGDADFSAVKVDRMPVAYVLPKKGEADADSKRRSAITKVLPALRLTNQQAFGKAFIVDAVTGELQV